MSFFQHPILSLMQMLCHHRSAGAVVTLTRQVCCALQYLALLVGFAWAGVALAQAPGGASPQDKVFQEVAQWVVQTQQVSASDFSFAPMDSRVQLQGCALALVMDSPFSSRETVRVRCLGNPAWQLYLRLSFKPGVTAQVSNKPLAAEPLGSTPAAQVAALVPAAPKQQVVVGMQLLRAGTLLTADLLQEREHAAGPGLDAQAAVSIKDVINGEMVRDVLAGVPLRTHDVRRALLVKIGQSVVLTVSQGSSFSITARVEALQDGKMGEQVRLRNPESGRLLSGVVTGPNAARGL